MKSRKEFNRLAQSEICDEILERKKLIRQMVGTLYPSILHDEITLLRSKLHKLWLKKDGITE